MARLLEDIHQPLSEPGLSIRSGKIGIIDTSVIEAKRPNQGKNKATAQDPEADWNIKAGADGKRT